MSNLKKGGTAINEKSNKKVAYGAANPEPMPKAGCKTIPSAMSRVQVREDDN